MATIKFSHQDEFINEISLEFGRLPAPPPFTLLRLTNLYKAIPNLAPIRRLFVVATIKVGDDIVRLERDCGDIWSIEEQDKKAFERAKLIHNEIERACEGLGIEVRAGVIEE